MYPNLYPSWLYQDLLPLIKFHQVFLKFWKVCKGILSACKLFSIYAHRALSARFTSETSSRIFTWFSYILPPVHSPHLDTMEEIRKWKNWENVLQTNSGSWLFLAVLGLFIFHGERKNPSSISDNTVRAKSNIINKTVKI